MFALFKNHNYFQRIKALNGELEGGFGDADDRE